jgi:hypothetical protein
MVRALLRMNFFSWKEHKKPKPVWEWRKNSMRSLHSLSARYINCRVCHGCRFICLSALIIYYVQSVHHTSRAEKTNFVAQKSAERCIICRGVYVYTSKYILFGLIHIVVWRNNGPSRRQWHSPTGDPLLQRGAAPCNSRRAPRAISFLSWFIIAKYFLIFSLARRRTKEKKTRWRIYLCTPFLWEVNEKINFPPEH